MSPVIFISAGEASGEHYGALLAAALRQQLAPKSERQRSSSAWAASAWRRPGVERVVRSEDMAVMGLTEVVRHLPRIYREFRKLKQAIRARRPDVAVLIDFPEIHFRLAREFHRLGVPVIFFVSPQLWAWKKHRIKLVQKYIRRMLVIFPFEEPFYRENGVQAEFVGHPLAELPLPRSAASSSRRRTVWTPRGPGSACCPAAGPRRSATICRRCWRRRGTCELQSSGGASVGDFEFIVPLAPTLNAAAAGGGAAISSEDHGGGLAVRLVDDARAALFHARASVVASGTATVEAALIGNPFVVVYRVSPLTYAIAKRVVKVPHVAMANLIAGKRVVPELIQHDFTAANIVQQIERLLPDGPARQSMMKELGAIREALSARRPAGRAKRGRHRPGGGDYPGRTSKRLPRRRVERAVQS